MNNFRKALKILYLNRAFPLFALSVMILFGLIGFYFPNVFADEQNKIIGELVSSTKEKDFLSLALLIILNNLRTAFIALFLGIFFGIIPFLAAALNGFILGAVIARVWQFKGFLSFIYLIPHGVFEIPALVISFGLGLKMGLWFRSKRKLETIRKNLSDFGTVYIYIVVPLLLIAGLIESGLISFI